MKPDGTTKVSAAKTAISEPAARDKENLVGAGRTLRSTASGKDLVKNEMSEKTAKIEAVKRKKVYHKGIQTTEEKIKVSVEDLTSEAGPSENYWEVLAERRRIALEDALEENSALTERIAKLEEENRVCKEMLDETRALVEVLQEMIGEDGNGINNSLDDSAL
ncbi:uncharacterized protein LOC124404971 isoform X2 [Diprion similis]|uniref:uncharacterized protein LOC124404971 isoform X2 n=1 Tax=Diprion similis TaxID=362088 RepID=UPI001EF76A9B|nr:uncharacterized protein LOC124404971 isoform X2 [Diprion similis]